MGLAARIAASRDESEGATSARSAADRESGGAKGFVPIFVMTNCRDNSCRAEGTLDGSPAGPDSTDVFSRASPSD